MTLDLLSQFLAPRGRRLVSANVGSLGGLVALQRGEAHLAGSHLLDPATGQFNLPYLPQYLPDVPVLVLTFVEREQGLIVAQGNPKDIQGLADLGRADLVFVNRQRGSGTRLLLDFHIDQIGVKPESIRGYPQEEYTHLAVAAAVASGRADVGLGIHAAAAALDLAFVPLFHERYDLIIPQLHVSGPLLAPMLDLLHEAEFRDAVGRLPGYDATRMGERVELSGTPSR
jgi:putative molybdopterin biosynthesis protein